MATFLDVSFFQKFSNLFIFLLILFLVYAILEKSKIFGDDKKALNALISFFLALIVLMFPKLMLILKTILPLFATLFIIAIFVFVGMKMFAPDAADSMLANKEVIGVAIIIMIVIVIAVIWKVNLKTTDIDQYGNIVEKNYTNIDDKYNATEIDANYETGIFNPKLLGLIMVLLIGVFTVRLMAGNNNSGRSGEE